MSHQLPRWEKAGYPLPSSVSVGLRWEPSLPGVPDTLPGWCGPSMRLSLAHALQPWVCLELTVPADPGALGPHRPLWLMDRRPFEPRPDYSCPQTPRSLLCRQVSLWPRGSLGGHPVTLHSELVCSLRGPGPNPTPDSHRGFPQGPLSTSPSVPRSLSSSLDLSSHTKERGLFNSILGPHPASRPLRRRASAHSGEPPL